MSNAGATTYDLNLIQRQQAAENITEALIELRQLAHLAPGDFYRWSDTPAWRIYSALESALGSVCGCSAYEVARMVEHAQIAAQLAAEAL